MTAKQKFEARLRELGIYDEWERNGYAGTQSDKEIIVLVHYDNDRNDPYSELHYPRFDAMTRQQMDELTHHFATEYYNPDREKESDFFSKLASWCAGFGPTPLFPCDVYTNLDPIEEIEFEDDATQEEEEEVQYQLQIENNKAQIGLIQQFQTLYKKQLVEMIRFELERGHNLPERWDPYPGWGSICFYGYNIDYGIEFKIKSIEDALCIAFPDACGEEIKVWLSASDFPIEVLLHIYAEMK